MGEMIDDIQLKSEIDPTPKDPHFFQPTLGNSSGDDENEWRRNWQPDLKCCPWKLLQTADCVYLVKTHFWPDSYQFLITDLSKFWYESISRSEFSKRLQKLNPNLEAPTNKILDHIKNNLTKNSSDHLNISKDENKSRLNVWINSDLAGFPFCWQMIGEPAHEEMVSENTTVPLLLMVSELFRRQKELFQIILEKDKEINNYKAQGCKLTKKNLSTLPFDETVFERKMLFSQEFEDNVKLLGMSVFESSGQELYQNLMTKYTWLQKCTKAEAELSKTSLEEPNTVFQQLEELTASVEREEVIQVEKVEVPDDDDDVPVYECPQCIFSTASQDLLIQHINMYHADLFENTPPPNPVQPTSTSIPLGVSSPLQPLSHTLSAEDNKANNEAENISCQQCGQRYKTQYGLQSHMNSKHYGKFLFNCSVCGRGFDSYWTYKTHVDRHSILAEKCDRCNLTFRFKKSLTMHRRFCGRTKNQNTDLYRCQICEQTCSSKDSLSTHMRGQHGSQHYRCRYCNKLYKWRSSLKYHTEKCFRKTPRFFNDCTEDQQSMLLVQA